MEVNLNLELKDHPGQLLDTLEPIADLGGNVISVLHHHKNKTPTGDIPVNIKLEVTNDEALNKILDILDKKNIRVVSIGKGTLAKSITLGLLGHIVHTDLKETIERIDNLGFSQVVNISLSMPKIEKESSAILVIELEEMNYFKKLKKELYKLAKEKDLTIIWSLGDH